MTDASRYSVTRLTMTVTLIAALPMSVPIVPLLVSGDVARAFAACALLALMAVLFARVVRGHLAAERRRGWWELGGLVAGGLAPWPFIGDGWLHVWSMVIAAATAVLRFGLSAALAAGAVTAAVLQMALGGHHRAQHHFAANLVVTPILTTGTLHYARRIADARAERAARAGAAVARDRRRVARELHDLLSHTLTAIRLKADLATVMADVDRARARAAVDELVAIANAARRDTGAAVAAHISLDFEKELAAAVDLLELSGVRCVVNAAADGLPAPVSDALGWIVREAATNVVKHSAAANCRIDLSRDSGRIVLRVHNDGVGGDGVRGGTWGGTQGGAPGGTRGGTRNGTWGGTRGVTPCETRCVTSCDAGCETWPGTRSEAWSETQPGTRSETRPGMRPETRRATRPETQPGTRSETRPGMRPETRHATRSETRSEMRSGAWSETRRGTRWGTGLHGVRERVEALGGSMSADGDDRSGFTLLVELGGHSDPRPAG